MEACIILSEKKFPFTEVICIPAMPKTPIAKIIRPIRISAHDELL
jgi:hypothetical protein